MQQFQKQFLLALIQVTTEAHTHHSMNALLIGISLNLRKSVAYFFFFFKFKNCAIKNIFFYLS